MEDINVKKRPRQLRVNPAPRLLSSGIEALVWFVKRDLLDKGVEAMAPPWTTPDAEKILKKQRKDGSWKYPGRRSHGFEEDDNKSNHRPAN
ncbi:MAG: hypothetical protein GY859_30925 [Desulfobacterales bacterium]|nr:hypothetical protein [Desulfobacterales bacterium]